MGLSIVWVNGRRKFKLLYIYHARYLAQVDFSTS